MNTNKLEPKWNGNTLGETSSTIYKVRWYERPVIDEMANKWVVFKTDDLSHCTNEIIPKIQAAYDGTYGKGIDPSAVEVMLDALKFAINIKELWLPSLDEAPAEHAGEMAALSQMRNVLTYAIEKAAIK